MMSNTTKNNYVHCANAAVQAFNTGNYRDAATQYLRAFDASPGQYELNRWQIFHGFTSILQEEYFAASETDISALKRIADDHSELKLYRCEAAFTFGLLLWIRNERDNAADSYRETLRLADKTKETERKRKVMATIATTDGDHVAGIGERPVGELIDEIRQQADDNLQQMQAPLLPGESPYPPPQYTGRTRGLRSDGTPLPPAERNTDIAFGPNEAEITLTREQANRLLTVGGETCDYCQKSRKELGVKLLQMCNACGKAFYCGRDCQKKQWKAGHRLYCRKPGQVKPGDYLRLHSIKAYPDLNGKLVEVVKEDPKTEGRWEVKIPGGEKSISVATGKMEQLRPLK